MSLILLLFLFIPSISQLFVQRNKVDEDLLSCSTSIIDDYAKHRIIVFYLFGETDDMHNKIINQVKRPMIVLTELISYGNSYKYLMVLFLKQLDDSYINMIQNTTDDIIFVLLEFTTNLKYQEIIDILDEFQIKNSVHDALLITRESRTTINVYTSVGFSNRQCTKPGVPIKICSHSSGKFNKYIHLSQIKRIRNMHGCPLVGFAVSQNSDVNTVVGGTGKYQLKGRNKILLDVISRKLNFEPLITTDDTVGELQNDFLYNNRTGKTKIILEVDIDFAIGMFSQLLFTHNTRNEFGKPLDFECYTWAVPVGAGKARSLVMNYLNEFDLVFWLVFLSFWGIDLFVTLVIQKVTGVNSELSFLKILENSLLSILGQPAQAELNIGSLRILISSWLAYTLVVRTAYLTAMWSFMAIPWYEINIRSLQELLGSQLEVGGTEELFVNLKMLSNSSRDLEAVLDRYTVLSDFDYVAALDRVKNKRDLAFIGEKQLMSSYLKYANSNKRNKSIHIVEGCVMNSFSTPLMFPYRSPLLEPMNIVMSSLFEVGLLQRDLISYDDNHYNNTSQNLENKDHINIHQTIQFLFYGFMLALFVFISELVVDRVCKVIKTNF